MQTIVSPIVFRARSLGLASVLLLFSAALPMAASAHFFNGSWAYSGGYVLPLSYQNAAGAFPAYSSAIDQAARDWYNTPTPSDLYSVPGSTISGGTANIYVYTIWDVNSGYDGLTRIQARHQVCTLLCKFTLTDIPYGDYSAPTPLSSDWSNYISATIALNRYWIDLDSQSFTNALPAVATHEFGHAQGLGHAPFSANKSIMTPRDFTIKTPQAHDVCDLNRLYPGPWPLPVTGC